MSEFAYLSGQLHAEGVPLADIARDVGTPVYVYSAAALRRTYRAYVDAFAGQPIQICYALKANGNLAVVRVLALEGAGADVVSEGELRRALAAGVPADRIVFSGVGKSESEMTFALDAGIAAINVESEPELMALGRLAAARNRRQPVGRAVLVHGTKRRVDSGVSSDARRAVARDAVEIVVGSGRDVERQVRRELVDAREA